MHLQLELSRQEPDEEYGELQPGRRRYRLRWARGDSGHFKIDWDEPLIKAVLAAEWRDPRAPVFHDLGEYLRDCIKEAGWLERERQIAEASGRREPISLHIATKCEELLGLPWELVRLDATGERLYEIDGLHIRYEYPSRLGEALRAPVSHWSGSRRPRVLFAWSAAGGGVPHESQRALLERAWGAEGVEELPEVTLETLEAKLCEARDAGWPVDILHLLTHGGVEAGSRALWLGQRRTPSELLHAIGPVADSLSLVVLCACSGSRTTGVARRAGSPALALHRGTTGRGGVPLVVGCRTLLSVGGADLLTRELHGGLATDQTVDQAVAGARRALCRDHSLEASGLQVFGGPAEWKRSPRPAEVSGGEQPSGTPQRRVLALLFAALGAGALLAYRLADQGNNPGESPASAPVAQVEPAETNAAKSSLELPEPRFRIVYPDPPQNLPPEGHLASRFEAYVQLIDDVLAQSPALLFISTDWSAIDQLSPLQQALERRPEGTRILTIRPVQGHHRLEDCESCVDLFAPSPWQPSPLDPSHLHACWQGGTEVTTALLLALAHRRGPELLDVPLRQLSPHCTSRATELVSPASAPCERPYTWVYASEMGTGRAMGGIDPLTANVRELCTGATDLADAIVIVDDPWAEPSGREQVQVGPSQLTYTHAAAQAIFAWNILCALEEQ